MDPAPQIPHCNRFRPQGAPLAEESKNFALKGNVIDLAVDLVMGAPFAKTVEWFVQMRYLLEASDRV